MGNSRIPRLKIELISCHTKSDSPLDFRNDVIGFEKKSPKSQHLSENLFETQRYIYKPFVFKYLWHQQHGSKDNSNSFLI